MTKRYILKWEDNYGNVYRDDYDDISEALIEFLSYHNEDTKTQLTALKPVKDENKEWDF